ncbi:MAG: caspase family protein [Sphaerochaetaceae bacterium]|nr:caspase family protein [Sphaerochaetaceae bacterium]
MKKINKTIRFSLLIFSLCLFISCELFYEQSPGRIILIGVGLDYIGEDESSTSDINGNAALENPPNDIREIAYALSTLASQSEKTFVYIPFIQQHTIDDIPESNYPNKDNLQKLFDELKNNNDISANVYDGNFDKSEYNLTSEYSTFGNEITSIDNLSENDILIFYYSGHGDQTNDGDLRLPEDKDEQVRESIPLSFLSENLNSLNCTVLTVLDSCGSGSFIEKSNYSVNTITTSFVDTIPELYETFFTSSDDNSSTSDLYAMVSTRAGELSFDTSSLDVNHPNSIFSYYFLRALGYENDSESEIGYVNENIPSLSKDRISIDSIYDYIIDNISREEPLINGGRNSLVLFNLN